MGTHPNGPSKIIKDNREILLSEEINGQLSYLFKILSINKPLSIQLHPEKTFAEILHRKFPKIYKDDNHKPELFIALSDFELLFGFVEMNKAIETIIKYKNCFNLKEGEKLLEEPNIENYKLFIEKLIFLEKDEYIKNDLLNDIINFSKKDEILELLKGIIKFIDIINKFKNLNNIRNKIIMNVKKRFIYKKSNNRKIRIKFD